MFGQAAAAGPGNINPNKDVQISPPLQDGISSLSFSPKANILVATSWDNNAYCWEINAQTAQAVAKASTSHSAPLLCSAWNADGTGVYTGGCDKTVKLWNLATNQSQQVAAHDAPVRRCAFIPEINLLVTGGWDKTLKYWDGRTANPVLTVQLPERVYAMDVKHPLLVVGCADRHIWVYNLASPDKPYKTLQSPLKWQTRCVACFPDKSGYLIGSIEGRVAVHHVEEANQSKNFTFKCHRDQADIYAVNSIKFHPQHGTFATAGGDGTYNFWDKDSKQRLKNMTKATYADGSPAPIPCSTFNNDGTIYAYALSYDWSRGFQAYNPQTMPNYIHLHGTADQEVKPRPKVAPTSSKR